MALRFHQRVVVYSQCICATTASLRLFCHAGFYSPALASQPGMTIGCFPTLKSRIECSDTRKFSPRRGSLRLSLVAYGHYVLVHDIYLNQKGITFHLWVGNKEQYPLLFGGFLGQIWPKKISSIGSWALWGLVLQSYLLSAQFSIEGIYLNFPVAITFLVLGFLWYLPNTVNVI